MALFGIMEHVKWGHHVGRKSVGFRKGTKQYSSRGIHKLRWQERGRGSPKCQPYYLSNLSTKGQKSSRSCQRNLWMPPSNTTMKHSYRKPMHKLSCCGNFVFNIYWIKLYTRIYIANWFYKTMKWSEWNCCV